MFFNYIKLRLESPDRRTRARGTRNGMDSREPLIKQIKKINKNQKNTTFKFQDGLRSLYTCNTTPRRACSFGPRTMSCVASLDGIIAFGLRTHSGRGPVTCGRTTGVPVLCCYISFTRFVGRVVGRRRRWSWSIVSEFRCVWIFVDQCSRGFANETMKILSSRGTNSKRFGRIRVGLIRRRRETRRFGGFRVFFPSCFSRWV